MPTTEAVAARPAPTVELKYPVKHKALQQWVGVSAVSCQQGRVRRAYERRYRALEARAGDTHRIFRAIESAHA